MEYATYSSAAEVCEGIETPPAPAASSSSISSMMICRKKKNNNSNNTRRFSDDQIKSLESIFETESRLEPKKKLQLARELGLQPRQVAIWFQNKRARWKSKQLERDYTILRNNYNNLASRFESLKKEKQALLIQLQKLNDLIQKPSMEKKTQSMDSESENGDTTKSGSELKVKPISQSSMAARSSEHAVLCGGGGGGGGALSDDDTSIKVEYFGNLEDGLVNFAHDHGDGSLTSPEDWGHFDSDDLLGQSTSDYQWWDFWS
ncbi:hypothetical protein HN51_021153 [Arachis hypogaea]|uniref:Homeobox-leucine zipper protein n=1 Tax=Arachis hypogaea TaxID=3818 RepID=A0A445EHU6_ARAHY|nr:homeobox-leucine zipper protein ATHB-12 [Arachis hypogaea]QHO52154.1 Homeobox-leucine zipper protein [Arachis hypogaea]RYR74986.1 hypothetical protein Ahy_A02g009696 [Arachis hypogaea]